MAEVRPRNERVSKPRGSVVLLAGVAGLCVLAALLTGGVTYAAWMATGTFSGGTITAGELSLTRGTPTWAQVTPGVSEPASGTFTATPADFFSMPGDVIEVTVPVTTHLRGDNLVGGLAVDYAEGATGPEDVTTSFRVEDIAGQQVAPAAGEAQFGQTVVVPGLVGDNDGETATWNVVVTVTVGGDYQWVTPQTATFPQSWDAGTLVFSLNQVREGAGFQPAGGGG